MKIREQFKKLVNDEFDGNEEFALKWLMDNAFNDWRYEQLEAKISSLESNKPEKEIRTLSGKKIEVNRCRGRR